MGSKVSLLRSYASSTSFPKNETVCIVAGMADESLTAPLGLEGFAQPGDEGLYALAEYLDGQDPSAAKLSMQGIQFVGAYNIRMTSPTSWLYAVEPLFRIDFADPDTDTENDRVTTLTAGIGVYLSSKAWFRVAYEQEDFQGDAESISGVRSMLAVSF